MADLADNKAALDQARNYWRSETSQVAGLEDLAASGLDEATLPLLADVLPILCWVANGDGYIVWYNRRWHTYCGTTPERMEGWGWTAVHDPALLPAVLQRWADSIATGQPFEMTFPLRGADGQFRPFLTRIVPVRDTEGVVRRWIGVNTDISDQVEAEAALKFERDRSRDVLENMGDAFVLLDSSFRVIEMNAAALRLETRSRADIVGRTAWEVWPGSEHGPVGTALRRALANRAPEETEYSGIKPDGGRVWLEIRFYPSADGLAVFYRDISDRKRQEAELRDSNARFRAIADSMPQMVWSTLPDGFHDYYNARWYEFTGVPVGSTDGEAWNGMFHPEDQERAWNQWRHSLETGEPYEIEYRLRHHTGEYRWTLGRALPIRDEAGAIMRWFGTCTDIHAARREAEQRELMSHELSHRIKNIFAVIAGLIGLSMRQYPDARTFALDLRERINALGRAHDLATPHTEISRPQVGSTTMHAMLRELFRPYPAMDAGKLEITGEDIAIDDRAATPMALIFHELATNATKYGALSNADGHVEIACARSDAYFTLSWRERGGPTISGTPPKQGFGSRLTGISVESQLSGTIQREWEPQGLTVTIVVPAASLTRARRTA